jgi:hypothetical protein
MVAADHHVRGIDMTRPGKWESRQWRPKFPLFDASETERMSNAAGVPTLLKLFMNSPEFDHLECCLPPRVSNSSYHPLHLALTLIVGFWLGYDCLEDLEQMQTDPILVQLFGEIPCAKSFGNFLRDFNEENNLSLREYLTLQSLAYRKRLRPGGIIFEIDSTSHEHHGDTIEGLAFNYKGEWCLDSLDVFDEMGFCYDFQLRSGSTFSSQGSVEMMKRILAHRPLLPDKKLDAIRADSAFCNEEFIRLCLLKKLKGTLTAHDNIHWSEATEGIRNWAAWVYTPEEMKKARLLGQELPRIEVGYYMYRPGWAENIAFPVVVKRTFKPYERLSKKEKAELIKDGKDPRLGLWKLYAVLSLMGLYPRSPQEILEFHQSRSNSENFIREGKINFDLEHFPCKPLTANTAYGLLGLIAHNFFRLIAYLDKPHKPHFAKKLRRLFVHLPGRLVRGSGKTYLKLHERHHKEVQRLVKRWTETFEPFRSTA